MCYLCLWFEECVYISLFAFFFFFKQKTAYEMRISDWSSDVCSSDLALLSYHEADPSFDTVTGAAPQNWMGAPGAWVVNLLFQLFGLGAEIGRASCRERVCQYV